MPNPIHPTEAARRVIAVALADLGEHVLERETAAAAIVTALVKGGHLPPAAPTPRYVPAVCRCYTPKPRPAVLDRQTGKHALLTSTDAAQRWAARWSLPGEQPSRLHAWHTAQAKP